MNELITETRTAAKIVSTNAHEIEEDTNQEMFDCLAKLKVWQFENLMAPRGMDKYSKRPERIGKLRNSITDKAKPS